MSYPMSREAYRKAIKQLNLTQEEAALLFNGKSARSGRRWALHGAPYHVALILLLMENFGITADDIEMLTERLHKRLASAG